MEGESAIGRPRPNKLLFDVAGDPRRASWRCARGCGPRSKPGSSFAGRHNRFSAFLKVEYAQDPDMQISHETIYLSLFVQSRGALA